MVSPLGSEDSLAGLLLVAGLLGLRHAADPDHLVAVSSLVAGGRERGVRLAARLGAAWGAGHALTLAAFGLPVLLAHRHLPELVQRLAEVAVGVLIVGLALQLVRRWRRGAYHLHEHDHDGVRHTHVHAHAATASHGHGHAALRSPRAAFAVGCLHGLGGSAAVAVLLLAGSPSREAAVAGLVVLAAGTAVSMTVLSTLVGAVLGAPPVRRRLPVLVPAGAAASALFGAWYALAAWELAPF